MRRFLWTVFVVLDAALLLLFSAGYTARYLHPRHLWWVQLIAIGLPYLALLLVGFTLIVGSARRWALFGVHAVLLALALVRFAPGRAAATAAAAQDALTLMTFNLGYPNNANAPLLVALARHETPHIISFQESFIGLDSARSQVRHIPRYLNSLIDSLGYSVIAPSKADTTVLRESIFSRGLVLESGQQQLMPGSDPNYRTSFSHARFSWQGREAVLYNLHLRTYGRRKPWADKGGWFNLRFWVSFWNQYREATLDRAREAEQIRALMDRESLPLLISGDFNSTPHSWDYHHLARGFQDAFRMGGNGWGGTYHRRFPLVRIDHLLVSPEFEVVSAHVAEAPLSDHRPLVVQLRWR